MEKVESFALTLAGPVVVGRAIGSCLGTIDRDRAEAERPRTTVDRCQGFGRFSPWRILSSEEYAQFGQSRFKLLASGLLSVRFTSACLVLRMNGSPLLAKMTETQRMPPLT